jgi:5-methyltetrahydropteroyltriglutamate--homocysteine methyltransferase
VPRIVGRIRTGQPVELRDMQFLRRHTDHVAKITLPGPSPWPSRRRTSSTRLDELAMDFAAAVNAEARDSRRRGRTSSN